MAKAESKPKSSRSAPASDGAPPRFLILHGEDRYRQDQHIKSLHAALARIHGEDGIDTVRFDGAAGPRIIADILDECRSGGLMQQYKVVLVENADLLLKADDTPAPAAPAPRGKRAPAPATPRELLEAYAAEPSDIASLVLRASTWRPGNLDKAVAKIGAVIKCENASEAEAVEWILATCAERHRAPIDRAAAAMLVSAVGTDMGRIDAELEKLALSAIDEHGKAHPITSDLIESMTGVSREEEFWAIQAALLTGETAAPLRQIRDLIEISRHDPVPITFSMVGLAQKIHSGSRLAASGAGDSQISGALRLWGSAAQQIVQTSRAVPPTTAARLLNSAVSTDAANKSGLGEPRRNIEILALRFAFVAARRRR